MFGILPCLAISSTDPVQYSWRLQEYTSCDLDLGQPLLTVPIDTK